MMYTRKLDFSLQIGVGEVTVRDRVRGRGTRTPGHGAV